ncbi:MAG: hypothetical protein NTU91_14275 [Chloroflexi bacterium]|nr:hypothetical protein [Chloroflexota bacterium]
MGLAELWENCDRILASSERTDFVDRVIFAQGFVCSGEADRIPTKNILMLWRSLAEGNMTSVASIAAEAAARLALSHDTAVVWIATDMLRESRLEPWQLPVVLGLDAKMEPHEVVGLFRKLANKSVGFIDQRAPRIQRLLASHIRHGRQSGRRE